jgi:hypothetical protein
LVAAAAAAAVAVLLFPAVLFCTFFLFCRSLLFNETRFRCSGGREQTRREQSRVLPSEAAETESFVRSVGFCVFSLLPT